MCDNISLTDYFHPKLREKRTQLENILFNENLRTEKETQPK